MRFAPRVSRLFPKLKVRTRLSLAFLIVILLSWLLNVQVFRYVIEQERQRVRREMAAQGITPPDPRTRHPDHHAPAGMAGPLEATRPDGITGPAGANGPNGATGTTGSGRANDQDRQDREDRRAAWRARVNAKTVPLQAGIAVLLSVGAGAWLARRFTRPLTVLEEGAHAFHERNFQHRIPRLGDDEFARVASSMNEMAERVEAQFAALETDARRRQQLLADVAHELRSPVATLKTMAEAMRDGLADQPARRERALSAMVNTADRLQRLVSDLMELAKLDLHELPLHVQQADLAQVAEESMAAHADPAAMAGIRLFPVCAEGPTTVSGDPMRLCEIVDNLLGNAIDHAGQGAEVRLTVMGSPDAVTLVVEDTGRGIPAAHMPFIFDPFYRADTVRTPGDLHSGLGLRIARALSEAHGGTLTLKSEEGHGTRVVLSLPVLPSPSPQPEPAQAAGAGVPAA